MRSPPPLEPVRHPEKDEAWFLGLTEAQQAELHAVHQRSADHDRALAAQARRRIRIACLQNAALFGLVDLLSPFASAGSVLILTATGAGLGAVLQRLDADRLLSITLGLSTYLVLEATTRGGLTVLHFFWCVVVGALSGLLALGREFGDSPGG